MLLETSDGVATITLNRPEAMNSLDVATKELLRDVVLDVADDPVARCVLLTATGRAFCVGQDLKEHVAILRQRVPRLAVPHRRASTTTRSSRRWRRCRSRWSPRSTASRPAPGPAWRFACDLRILADPAGFNLAFAGVGALLRHRRRAGRCRGSSGRAKALELLYFPRTVSAQEALELGLATPGRPGRRARRPRWRELAARLAPGPTVAFGAIRPAVAYSAGHSLEESLAFEADDDDADRRTADHRAAVDAFLAKEKPVFQGR